MRRTWSLLAFLAALVALAVSAVSASAAPAAAISSAGAASLTATQVIARFKVATGSTLLVDKRMSYVGHYTALSLSPSISNLGRYGRFTLYVIEDGALAADVEKLLSDAHTGQLGTPGAASIYWESGRYLSGGTFWLAKKQYGTNLVLWWYGTEKKVNPAFTRIHKPLVTKVLLP